jgi:hypothetical protein
MDCFVETCKADPELKCECADPPLLFCASHIISHCKSPGKHNITNNYRDIGKIGKLALISSFTNCISKCKAVKESIEIQGNTMIKKIITQMTESINRLREIEMNYYLAIQIVEQEHSLNPLQSGNSDKLSIKYLENKHQMEEDIVKIEQENNIFNNICFDVEKLKKLKKTVKKLKNELNTKITSLQTVVDKYQFLKTSDFELINELNNILYQSKHIYYFEKNSNNLVDIDIVKNSINKQALYIYEDMCDYAGYCKLSESLIFYYGGYNKNTYPSSYYIINAKKKTVVTKGNRFSKRNFGCCAYNNIVYVFGGVRDNVQSVLNESECYNIASDSWQLISNLPVSGSSINTAIINNEIVLTGTWLDRIYFYNIDQNNYTAIFNLVANAVKIMFKGSGKIYILSNSKTYEIDSFNSRILTHNKSFVTANSKDWLISYSIRYQNMIYFILSDYNLYRFNLLTKEIQTVRKLIV